MVAYMAQYGPAIAVRHGLIGNDEIPVLASQCCNKCLPAFNAVGVQPQAAEMVDEQAPRIGVVVGGENAQVISAGKKRRNSWGYRGRRVGHGDAIGLDVEAKL